jgi:DNA-binding CsgD family transcriptional regulator
MAASLCIQVYSGADTECHDIAFFDADCWTPESEKQLLAKIQDLLGVVRSMGKTFDITIRLDVTNLNEALFLIRKKINNKVEINNAKLSIREIEVLGLIMQGNTNQDIADKLFISYETVRSHRKNILEKTGAKNTAALINYYHQTFFEK